ncbi:MAG: TolC family protein [Burkholderiaceae bacterium]|jgi:outer membrane protein|nr:TolC family protein [Burkholderiaceae bacterium]
MSGKPLWASALMAGSLITCAAMLARPAWALDVLLAEQNISATPAGAMVPAASACPRGAPGQPLQLAEAVARALCSNPKTRQAWTKVKIQAAMVGQARAAYLPQVSGNLQAVQERSVIDIKNEPTYGSDYKARVRSGDVTLSWLLFDFGAREATLTNANMQLEAARATQDATLQTVFAETAKDYYATQAAMSALKAAAEVERMTRKTMDAAGTRADRGVVPITDALQAQTQHEQAVFNLTKAQGEAQTALGKLASGMALAPDMPLEVPEVTDTQGPGKAFSESVAELMDTVRKNHPSVRAAQAQYEAALAKVSKTSRQGLPRIDLVAKYSRNNQPESLGLQGLPTLPATSRQTYVGLQMSIPFFEGFTRNYQVDQAQAEAEDAQEQLDAARQQVALDVWSQWQALSTATQNVQNSTNLLTIAGQSQRAAQQRYEAGVGNILELLNTQTDLTNAQQRRIQALTDWDYARIDLASKLGRLDASDLQQMDQKSAP